MLLTHLHLGLSNTRRVRNPVERRRSIKQAFNHTYENLQCPLVLISDLCASFQGLTTLKLDVEMRYIVLKKNRDFGTRC